ncbi:MAG TPA: hypothetical protein PK566_14010 [Pseudobacteroides sp.]|mgnify:CR=1 FL=1|nr:hypothetical protein [Pseudobacteroides sp.]
MSLISRIVEGWKKLASYILQMDLFTAICVLLILTAIVLLMRLMVQRINTYKIKQFYSINKDKRYVLRDITQKIKKNRYFLIIAENIAFKIGMFNNYSYERNLEFATMACFAFLGAIILSIIIFIPLVSVIWYILLFYIFMAVIFAVLLFYIFTMIARSRFNNQLPETFKIINSRYITHGNILKAINVSLNDFDKAVKREMIKIYDVLKKNDMYDIDNTFRMIDRAYKNQYVSLLLNLIKQAHYKGGNNVIKEQIENTTEEILIDIANQKDLSASTRTYVFLSIFLLPGILFVERFNYTALGEKSVEFYSSPYGVGVKLGFLIALMFYIGMMLFLERTSD